MIGATQGVRIGITGLGVHVPAKVVTNAELAGIVDTSDEWIRERMASASAGSRRPTRR